MKKLAGVILALLLSGCAVAIPKEELEFEKIVAVPQQSKDQIYKSVKLWVAKSFKSSSFVTDLDSKEDGLVVVKATMQYPCEGFACLSKYTWVAPFTMRVDIKDGRFRASFSDIKIAWPESYNSGVRMSAYEGPVSDASDLKVIKDKLLSMVDDVNKSIDLEKSKSEW